MEKKARLQEIAESRGIELKTLAEAIGRKEPTLIRKMESGSWKLSEIGKLSEALKLSSSEIGVVFFGL